MISVSVVCKPRREREEGERGCWGVLDPGLSPTKIALSPARALLKVRCPDALKKASRGGKNVPGR